MSHLAKMITTLVIDMPTLPFSKNLKQEFLSASISFTNTGMQFQLDFVLNLECQLDQNSEPQGAFF